jgi:hypothetical protein
VEEQSEVVHPDIVNWTLPSDKHSAMYVPGKRSAFEDVSTVRQVSSAYMVASERGDIAGYCRQVA